MRALPEVSKPCGWSSHTLHMGLVLFLLEPQKALSTLPLGRHNEKTCLQLPEKVIPELDYLSCFQNLLRVPRSNKLYP